jgi:hypothetical protein
VLQTWSGGHHSDGQTGAQIGLEAIAAIEFGGMSKALLEMLELCQCPPDEIVGTAARAREVLGKLGERPVLVEVETAGLALVLGEHRAVDVKEPLLPRA